MMRGLVKDTLAEMVSRKLPIMYGLLLLVSVMILLALRGADWHLRVDGVDDTDVLSMVNTIPLRAIMTFTWFLTLLTLFASSGSLASLYTSGRVDFYLSKPIGRARLFLSKLGSTWIVYGAAIVGSALVVTAAVGLFFGVFEPRVLVAIGMYLFVLLIYLSVGALIGAASGSQSLTYVSLFLFWLVQTLLANRELAASVIQSSVVRTVLDIMYYVLPKPGEIGDLATNYLLTGVAPDLMPAWTSALGVVALLVMAIGLVRQREF